jgi:hypothetical protein
MLDSLEPLLLSHMVHQTSLKKGTKLENYGPSK